MRLKPYTLSHAKEGQKLYIYVTLIIKMLRTMLCISTEMFDDIKAFNIFEKYT